MFCFVLIPNGCISREWCCWRATPLRVDKFSPNQQTDSYSGFQLVQTLSVGVGNGPWKETKCFPNSFQENKNNNQKNRLLFSPGEEWKPWVGVLPIPTPLTLSKVPIRFRHLAVCQMWTRVGDLFFPLNVYLKIRKQKVASEVANPI